MHVLSSASANLAERCWYTLGSTYLRMHSLARLLAHLHMLPAACCQQPHATCTLLPTTTCCPQPPSGWTHWRGCCPTSTCCLQPVVQSYMLPALCCPRPFSGWTHWPGCCPICTCCLQPVLHNCMLHATCCQQPHATCTLLPTLAGCPLRSAVIMTFLGDHPAKCRQEHCTACNGYLS